MGEAWLSTTTRFRCPEGSVYITIARSQEEPHELRRLWVTVGKTGSAMHAAGDALSAVTKLALDSGVPRDSVAKYLCGISHDDYNKLVHQASSVSDALGQTLRLEEDYWAPSRNGNEHEAQTEEAEGSSGGVPDVQAMEG